MADINRVVLVGRLVKDPELRTTQNGISTCTFTVASNRRTKDEADFPQCIAWRQQAEFLCRYGHKGDQIGLEGRIQTRTYEKDDRTVYVTEVMVDSLQLLGGKKEASQTYDYNTTSSDLTGTSNAKKEPMIDQIQFDYGTRSRNDTVKLGEIEAQNLSGDDLPF